MVKTAYLLTEITDNCLTNNLITSVSPVSKMNYEKQVHKVLGEDNMRLLKTEIREGRMTRIDLEQIARKLGGTVYGTFVEKKEKTDRSVDLFRYMLDTWYNDVLCKNTVLDGYQELIAILKHEDVNLNVIAGNLTPVKAPIIDIGLKKNHQKIRELENQLMKKKKPGVPARVSNQGQKETCSSHSVGKAIVDILDWAGWNAKQETIIDDLIEKYQSDGRAGYPDILFNNKKVEVEVTNKKDESKKTKCEFKIKILKQEGEELEPGSHDYNTPPLGEDLKENQLGMVLDWDYYNITLGKYTPHAVYAEKYSTRTEEFTCINSWGPNQNDKPKVSKAKVRDIYYVSIEQQSV